MITKKVYLFFLSVFLLHGLVVAQDTLTLERAVEKTLQQNFSIQILQNTQEIARINNTWAHTGGIPLLRFTGSATHTFVSFFDDPAEDALETKNTTNADYTQQNLSTQIALQWTIFDGFSARIQKERLEQLEKLSGGNVQVLLETSVYATILAYYSVIVQKQKMQALSYIHGLSKDRYEYQKSLQELGVATTFEVLQAQNAWLQDSAQLVLQIANYRTAIRDLQYYMADTDDVSYVFPDSFEPQHIQFNKDELLRRISTHNAEVQNKYVQIAILEQEQKLARSRFFPTLSFQSGVGYTYNSMDYGIVDPVQTDQQRVFAGLSLQYDIYSGGVRKRASQIAEIQTYIKTLELQDMLLRMYHEVEQEYELYTSRKVFYAVSREQYAAATLQYDLAQERFSLGTISSFDFRTVQMQYLQAAVQIVEARYLNILSELTLFRLTGDIIK